jgi:hypothetical protein
VARCHPPVTAAVAPIAALNAATAVNSDEASLTSPTPITEIATPP